MVARLTFSMPRLTDIARSLRQQPGYTLMRGMARFGWVRHLVGQSRRLLQAGRLRDHLAECESQMAYSMFADIDRAHFVSTLRADGVAFGLRLPPAITDDILRYAAEQPCFADRMPDRGFLVEERTLTETKLGKPILVAQYFNAAGQCAAIDRLLTDPALQWIAGNYLGSVPTFVGSNLWWTFPVQALEEDRDRHAHRFHRDVDDFRFFKFFFYLTDVNSGDGAHVCVIGSHRQPPILRAGDRWRIRRYSDAEVGKCFSIEQTIEVCGQAGTGFAENTLCLHKGLTPTHEPRLLLQLQFALFDHGVMHDVRPPAALRMLA